MGHGPARPIKFPSDRPRPGPSTFRTMGRGPAQPIALAVPGPAHDCLDFVSLTRPGPAHYIVSEAREAGALYGPIRQILWAGPWI